MEWVIIALLIAAAGAAIAEFFLPGGILGILAALMALGATIITYQVHGVVAGTSLLAIQMVLTLIGILAWIKYFPTSPIGRWFTLTEDVDTPAAEAMPTELIGKRGETITRLNPSGVARIGGQRVSVVVQSGYLEADCPIQVVNVEQRRIVVRESLSTQSSN